MYTPLTIISENKKTGVSINFPMKGHCRPSKLCQKLCYARSGHMALPNTVKKQNYVSDYFTGNDLLKVIVECKNCHAVRLNGCGDLLPDHVNNIINLANECPKTMFYGMTRKPEIAKVINDQLPNLRLLLSIDATTPKKVWSKFPGKMCFGPRRDVDTVPDDPRIIIVFPYHCHGSVVKNVPKHPLDCLAVWHEVSGCLECARCWDW